MEAIRTPRLSLSPFSIDDFDLFVSEMLTDPRVIEFFYSYQNLDDKGEIRTKALKDFWEHFEESRKDRGYEIWAARKADESQEFIGWSGLLHTDLSSTYGGPELQYMLSGNAHGQGYATELAAGIMNHASKQALTNSVIATVDIPNAGSIRVLEKLGFTFEGQIEAYGSTEMYLYRKDLQKS